MSLTRIVTVCIGVGFSATLAVGQEPAGIPVPAPVFSPDGAPLTNSAVPPPLTWSPRPVYDGAYCDDDSAGEDVISPAWARWYSKWCGKRKAPFQKYNHHAGDLRARPVMSPLCSPTWGYHETCWREFPPVPLCPPQCPPYTASTATAEVDQEPATVRPRQTIYRANNTTRD